MTLPRRLRLYALRARRDVNNMLAACVVVMAFVLAQTLVACNEERAGRMVAEENVVRLKRAEALRQAGAEREFCQEGKYGKRRYRFCRWDIRGDS